MPDVPGINGAGFDLIKHFEGFEDKPYLDQGGVATIGYGHTKGVTMESPVCTQAQAEEWLDDDLQDAMDAVDDAVTIGLTDNQYAALVSLVFNCGPAPLKGTLGRVLNTGDYTGAAMQFPAWDHVHGIVNDGLLKRRQAEMKLFNTPDAP